MSLKSIRWRLPLSYAWIALLSVVTLGLVLNTIIRFYYNQQEMKYLEGNAIQLATITSDLLQAGLGSNKLADQVNSWSFLIQTRIQVFNLQGKVLADSGLPDYNQNLVLSSFFGSGTVTTSVNPIDSGLNIAARPDVNCVQTTATSSGGNREIDCYQSVDKQAPKPTGQVQGSDTIENPTPATDSSSPASATPAPTVNSSNPPVGVAIHMSSTIFGFNLAPEIRGVNKRSTVQVDQIITDSQGKRIGRIILSNPPAYGEDVENWVTRGWLTASFFGVVLAGGVGFWVSRRMTAPLIALTGATTSMATGDLSVRAAVRSKDEFGELGRSFNAMAERVEEIVATLRGFVADAAHELNTPLATIRASLELVRNHPALPEMVRDNVNQAWEGTRRLETLARDLLDLSRLETSEMSVPPEAVDLNKLVSEACEPFASQAEQRGVQFGLEIRDTRLSVTGNRTQLYRIADNLLENALKFTPPGGYVNVALFREDQEAVFQILDSGIGVPSEDLPFVFNRFHRGRNATAYQGNGLGLAIVKAIIDRHGGKINLVKREVGTKVEVHLPCIGEEPSESTGLSHGV